MEWVGKLKNGEGRIAVEWVGKQRNEEGRIAVKWVRKGMIAGGLILSRGTEG